MKTRVVDIEPIEYEETTKDIILNNTKAGKSYYTMSFRGILNVTDNAIKHTLLKLSEDGYFEDLGMKVVKGHNARVFKRK